MYFLTALIFKTAKKNVPFLLSAACCLLSADRSAAYTVSFMCFWQRYRALLTPPSIFIFNHTCIWTNMLILHQTNIFLRISKASGSSISFRKRRFIGLAPIAGLYPFSTRYSFAVSVIFIVSFRSASLCISSFI